MGGTGENLSGWTLWTGPGERLWGLSAVLTSLRPLAASPPRTIAALGDVDELARPETPCGRVVLDADRLPSEDLGYVRRFLARNPGWSLCLVGEDVGRQSASRLLAQAGARWIPWPPDLVEIQGLLDPPAGVHATEPAPMPPPTAPPPREEIPLAPANPAPSAFAEPSEPFAVGDDDDLAAIQAILDVGPPAAQHHLPGLAPLATPRTLASVELEVEESLAPLDAPGSSQLDELDADAEEELGLYVEEEPHEEDLGDGEENGELDLDVEDELDDIGGELDLEDDEDLDLDEDELDVEDPPSSPFHATAPPPAPSRSPEPREPAPLPGYFRDQVADLADIAQRIDLGLQSLQGQEGSIEPLEADVARLIAFTRTLGYLVAPPKPGGQRVDLGILLEELARGLVAPGLDAPRCLFRKQGDLVVHSDKELLLQAFDALLVLARSCASAREIVRVQVREVEDLGPYRVRAVIEFPRGPLRDVPLEAILRPYGLRRILPDVGSNALGAALSILAGQGGRADLTRVEPGHLRWTVLMPAAERALVREPGERSAGGEHE